MRLDREPEIGRLDVVAGSEAAALGGEGLHARPVADMLDHAVGMDQVEGVVGVLRQGAGVAVDHLEQGRIGGLVHAAGIDDRDADLAGVEEGAVEQGPVGGLAAQVGDANGALLGMDAGDQGDDAPGPRAAEARHERVGVVVVLEGVDQVHEWTLTRRDCIAVKRQP